MHAVFERDFTSFSVSRRFQVLRFAFAGVMGLMLLIRIVPAHTAQGFADVGGGVLATAAWIGLGLVLVTVPGSFSTVLVHARAGSTLPVLLTTPMSVLSIAAAAFAARAAIFFVLILATMPPLALSLLYGGVRVSQLFATGASIAASGLLVAAPSFVASAFARRTSVAVVTGYLTAVATVAGLYVIAEGPWGLAAHAAAYSPLHAIASATDTGGTAAPSTLAPVILLTWSALLSIGAILLVAWRLAREGRGTADESRTASLSGKKCRPLVHENPVLDHEMRSAGVLRRGATGRGLFALLLFSEGVFVTVAASTNDWTSLPMHFSLLAMQGFLLALAVTAAGATALAAEREGRTLDLVRVTPLTPREIVIGKLLGLFRGFGLCLAVPLGHLVLGACLGVFSFWAVPLTAITGSVALAAWAVFALSQALDQANPNQAVLRTMAAFGIIAVLVAVNVGLPVNSAFDRFDEWVRRCAAFGANPIALTLLPAAALRIGGSDSTQTLVKPPQPGDIAFALVCGAVWLALYVGVGIYVYRLLFNTYKSRVDG